MNSADSEGEDASAKRERMWAETRERVERRALIEQAKGILMFVYGIDADEAFDILRSRSQDDNIKLRLLAEQIVKDMVELGKQNNKGPARRVRFDGLMLTAHQRISKAAERQRDGQCKTGVPMKDLGE
jgi:hypothetical protein